MVSFSTFSLRPFCPKDKGFPQLFPFYLTPLGVSSPTFPSSSLMEAGFPPNYRSKNKGEPSTQGNHSLFTKSFSWSLTFFIVFTFIQMFCGFSSSLQITLVPPMVFFQTSFTLLYEIPPCYPEFVLLAT